MIGKVFWAGALARLGGSDVGEVREGLHELARKELLRPARRPSIEGEAEYAFWHLLIRDVAYGQIPRAARAVKHQAAAAWIEKIAGERVADSSELLAHHYGQALELSRAAGQDVTGLEGLVVRYLMLAADRALRLDLGKAGTYVNAALELTESGEADRFRVLLFAGRLLFLQGPAGSFSDDLLLEAVEEARSAGDPPGEAEALAWLSRLAWVRGDTARQVELLGDAARIMEGRPPSRESAIVMTRVVAAHGLAGRTSETLAAGELALPVVREFGSETDLAVVLQMRGQALVDAGQVAQGFEDLREGLRIALESAPASFAASAHVNLGDNVWFADGPVKGQELYEAGADLADRRGSPGSADWARMQSMWVRYDLGAWDELLDIGQGILEREQERGAGRGSTQLSVLAEAYQRDVVLHRGVSDGQDGVVGTLLERAREIGDSQVVVPVFRVAALERLGRGDVAGALELVAEIDEVLRDRQGVRSWLLDWASRVCLAAGDPDLLRSLIERGIEYLTRDANSLEAARAVLARLEGDHATALERYDDVAARWAAFPSVLEHGHALAGAGRSLLDLDRPGEAVGRLREARDRYASLGAATLVTEVDDLLALATAQTS